MDHSQSDRVSCPICTAPSAYDFSGRNVLVKADMTRYDYYKCAACGVFFLHPMPDAAALDELYPDSYVEPDDLERAKAINPLKLARLRLHHGYAHLSVNPLAALVARLTAPFRKADRAIDFVPGGRLLDVGCGNGRYLRTMRSLGWQAEGVELNRQSAAFCRSSGLTVHHGDLASARFPSASFDVITARHVIEHIPTPHQFMAELARLLVSEAPELYPRSQDRLLQVEYAASNIGWGYCDSVREQVQMLETTLGKEEETAPPPPPRVPSPAT